MATNIESMVGQLASDVANRFSVSPLTWAQMISHVYQAITTKKRKPIVNKPGEPHYQDRTYYDNLCRFYRDDLHKMDVYSEWALDEASCPLRQPNFLTLAHELKKRVNELRVCDQAIALLTSSIIEGIAELFENLAAHRRLTVFGYWDWQNVRPDGVEVMFFSELAMWLGMDLPLCEIKRPETALLVQRRIEYCKHIQESVLIYRNDESRRNPKNQLSRIISALEVLHQDIIKAHQAASFKDKIEQIDIACLGMTKHTFDVLYLLLKRGETRELHVDTFLMPGVEDAGIRRLQERLLGKWISETLNTAGIKANNYKTSAVLDLSRINTHLGVEYRAMPLNKTGLLRFARENETKAWQHIERIRELHQLLLKLYYVRESLGPAAQLGNRLGEIWLYGDATGKEFVSALLTVIGHAAKALCDKMDEFWTSFYSVDYVAYSRARHLDITDTGFGRLAMADEAVKRMRQCHETISAVRREIRTDADAFSQTDKDLTEKKKRDLIHRVFGYLMSEGLNVDDYVRLKSIVMPRMHGAGGLETVPGHTESYHEIPIERISIAQLPVYSVIKTVLWSPIPSAGIHALPTSIQQVLSDKSKKLQRPIQFLSLLDEQLFEHFLVQHYDLSTRPLWIGSFKISNEKRAEFQTFYRRVRAAFEHLYQGEPIHHEHAELRIKDQQLVEQQLLAAMKYYYQHFYENPHFSFLKLHLAQPSVLVQEHTDGTISTGLAEHLLPHASGALAQVHNALQARHRVVEEDCDNARATVIQQERVIGEKNEALAGRDAALARKDTEIVSINLDLAAKIEAVADKDRRLADKDRRLADKDRRLADKDRRLADKDRELADKDTVIASKDIMLQQLRAEREEMRRKLAALGLQEQGMFTASDRLQTTAPAAPRPVPKACVMLQSAQRVEQTTMQNAWKIQFENDPMLAGLAGLFRDIHEMSREIITDSKNIIKTARDAQAMARDGQAVIQRVTDLNRENSETITRIQCMMETIRTIMAQRAALGAAPSSSEPLLAPLPETPMTTEKKEDANTPPETNAQPSMN